VECRTKVWCKARVQAAAGLAIRFYLDRERRLRDRALFDLAIDSKLRGCHVVKVRIGDLVSGARSDRAQSSFSKRPAGRFNSNC
jgi:hypothetical protein